jgi:regulator of protease activity HflC (stomatin/prohibitin superfamily)
MLLYLIILLVVIAAIITLLIVFKGFFMVSQGQAAVIERLGKFNRVVTSGLHLKLPFLEKFRVVGFVNRPEFRNSFGPYRIDLREQIYDISKQRVITKDNVRVDVDTIIYYKVTHPEKTVYGITDLPKALEQLALTHIRNEFGRMDLDVSLGARTEMNQNLEISLAQASEDWGIDILRVEVQEIVPPVELEEPMEKNSKNFSFI